MSILMFFITLALLAISFFCGLCLSEIYHARSDVERENALKQQYARLIAGVDRDDSAQPYVAKHRFSVSKEFADRLHEVGRATMKS